MNTQQDKKTLCVIKVHSIVDLITNSSTEIFCVVKADTKNHVQKIINEILNDCGCEVLSDDNALCVNDYVKYDEETGDDIKMPGHYEITYEQHAPPCKLILKRLKEVFEVKFMKTESTIDELKKENEKLKKMIENKGKYPACPICWSMNTTETPVKNVRVCDSCDYMFTKDRVAY